MNGNYKVYASLLVVVLALIGIGVIQASGGIEGLMQILFQTTAGVNLVKPHFGSINCEGTGGRVPWTVDSDRSIARYTNIGKEARLNSIHPTPYTFDACGFLGICTTFNVDYTLPSSCDLSGFNLNTLSTFSSVPPTYTFFEGQAIRVSDVFCETDLTYTGIFGEKRYVNTLTEWNNILGFDNLEKFCKWDSRRGKPICKADQFKLTGDYEPMMLYKYFDSAHIQLEGTQQCTFQDIWVKLGANQGDQILSSTDEQKVEDVGVKHGLDGKLVSGDFMPQKLRLGEGVLYIQYWESIPDFNVQEYRGPEYTGYVYCSSNNAMYRVDSVTSISGTQYYIPSTYIKNVECCWDSAICTLKYGSGWFCSSETFTCEKTAECVSDLQCNPAGKQGCVYENGQYYIYDARCVNGECVGVEHELVGPGRTYQCCRSPTDTCPKNTDPPQFCGEDFKCHAQVVPEEPCLKQCCVDEPNTQVITCQDRGYGPDYVCCLGVCETTEECYGICNYNDVCESWETIACADCGCNNNEICEPQRMETKENCEDCVIAICGNGVCEGTLGESFESCPQDCKFTCDLGCSTWDIGCHISQVGCQITEFLKTVVFYIGIIAIIIIGLFVLFKFVVRTSPISIIRR